MSSSEQVVYSERVRCPPGHCSFDLHFLFLPVPAAALSLQSKSHWGREDSSVHNQAPLALLSKIAQPLRALSCLAEPPLIYLASFISGSNSTATSHISFPLSACDLGQVSPVGSGWMIVLFLADILVSLGPLVFLDFPPSSTCYLCVFISWLMRKHS